MIRPGVCSFAVMIAARPIGPAPTIATVSPGCDAPVQDADLVGRRQDVGEEQHLLVAQAVRHLVDGGVGERHACELGLEAVDHVAEDPAAATGAEAVVALLAEAAAPARADARDEHAVADGDRRDGRADLDDGADRLVAENRSRLHLGHVALEDVQVGAADRRRVDPDDRVGRLDDRRVGDGLPCSARRGRGRRVLSSDCLSRVGDRGVRVEDEVDAVRSPRGTCSSPRRRRRPGRARDCSSARTGRRRCGTGSRRRRRAGGRSGPSRSSPSVKHIGELPSQQPPDWKNISGPCSSRRRPISATAASVATILGARSASIV